MQLGISNNLKPETLFYSSLGRCMYCTHKLKRFYKELNNGSGWLRLGGNFEVCVNKKCVRYIELSGCYRDHWSSYIYEFRFMR